MVRQLFRGNPLVRGNPRARDGVNRKPNRTHDAVEQRPIVNASGSVEEVRRFKWGARSLLGPRLDAEFHGLFDRNRHGLANVRTMR